MYPNAKRHFVCGGSIPNHSKKLARRKHLKQLVTLRKKKHAKSVYETLTGYPPEKKKDHIFIMEIPTKNHDFMT